MKIQLHTDIPDETLLQHFKQDKSQEAFGILYSRYIPLVYGQCLRYLRKQEDAEDAVMHIYEEVNRKVAHYEIESFKAWLYTVTKNYCLKLLQKTNKNTIESLSEVETEPIYYLIEDEENEEKNKALDYCLTTLPNEQNKCVKKFFMDDLSYADIVKLSGYTLNQVKSYIQNGKRNLKSCMLKLLNL